ncbi:oligopeptide ABC transporter substrate-binding protein OppA [Mergibacter septicus]|uniref:Oligopeptide ABC transporter substrate-binding protein OppA n=1 Tax=Mergibacter septicus TaxID=221402 RepID=A0A8D4IYZ9_9PAST|nr:ABC transporter substrate-binding protein [Mergibacter septicus]AWX15029.1 oligopeptide ABC transporter substrate-binding protein OppA [Mergibacter septicus]QDJ14281.1 oligopeptide ABC transporter substrate-binding protein OppA [Mergibacter septicus]WMR96104.1 ABC transporter substrate-binding protein [Mergibacter septicus]
MTNKRTNKFARLLLSLAIAATFTTTFQTANAAVVPAGTHLAQQQSITLNIGDNPATFDPQKAEGAPEGDIARQLFETLVISDDKGHILPAAATAWEHSPDFKTWTFHLRPDAKWSNGDPVTAEDFVYGWQRLADPKTASPYSSYLDFLKLENADDVIQGKKPVTALGVEAKDPQTLVLHLSESVPYADKLTELYVLSPANKKVIEKYGDAWTKPENIVGNGAFKLKSATLNEKYVLEPNTYYWDNKNTVLQKITFLPISSPATSFSRYRAGELDVSSFPIEAWKNVKKDYQDQLNIAPVLCTYYYEINNKKAPFNDVRVRKALALAFQPEIITDKILGQGQIPAYQFTPAATDGAEKIQPAEWKNWSRAERNAEALKLLQQAGYNKSNPLKINLLYNTSESHKQLALAADSFWKKNLNGAVKVTLENQEWKTYLDTKHQGNFDVARAGWCADYNEASTFLTYFLSNSGNNTSFYQNKDYDNLIAQAYKANSDDERAAYYAKAEQLLNKDVPIIPVYHYVSVALIKPYVKGYSINNPIASRYLKDVYIIQR